MKVIRLLVMGLVLLAGSLGVAQSDIYFAQSAQGNNNGADCNDAIAMSSLAWAAGNTYHVCGTISSGLTVGASGTSGSPITVLFEAGAMISMPALPTTGAINVNGQSYVTIDGGGNGVIQGTANGTPGDPNCINGSCSSQTLSQGVYCSGSGCHDLEIRNLTVSNIYVHTTGNSDGTGAPNGDGGITISGAGNNISIHNNYVNNAAACISANTASGTVSNLNIYSNKTDQCNWHIQVGSAGTLNGYTIHDNEIINSTRWYDGTVDRFHHDGIFVYVGSTAYLVTSGQIYNNWWHGDMGGNATSKLYLSDNITYTYIFDNVFDDTSQTVNHNGVIYFGYGADHTYILNNTFVGTGSLSGESAITTVSTASNITIQNNIISGFASGNSLAGSPTITTYDNDLYYNITGLGANWFTLGSNTYNSWAAWQGTGYDAHGQYANPLLDASYQIQSGSPAIGLAANLTSLGITALDSDKAGAARPSSGAWDAGAYQFGSAAGKPAPPTGLTATVK